MCRCVSLCPSGRLGSSIISTKTEKGSGEDYHSNFASLEEPCSADQQTQSHSNYLSMRSDHSCSLSQSKRYLVTPGSCSETGACIPLCPPGPGHAPTRIILAMKRRA
jgi:ferredoxin